jgi:TrmH family RNA methyltransferase
MVLKKQMQKSAQISLICAQKNKLMLSKNKIKYIQSLKDKKHRTEHSTFVAEGAKLVFDLLAAACRCQFVAALPEVIAEHREIVADEVVIAI